MFIGCFMFGLGILVYFGCFCVIFGMCFGYCRVLVHSVYTVVYVYFVHWVLVIFGCFRVFWYFVILGVFLIT